MNLPLKNLLTLCFISLCSSIAWSHDHTENTFYVGLKSGALFADEPKVESTNALGIQLEYHFNPNLSIEADYSRWDSDEDNSSDNLNFETLAAYAVLRSRNTTYALIKMGLQNNLGSSAILKQSRVNLSAGIGAGVIINRRFSVESEYTLVNENFTYLGITLRVGF